MGVARRTIMSYFQQDTSFSRIDEDSNIADC